MALGASCLFAASADWFDCDRRRHQEQGPLYPYVAVGLTRERSELNARIAVRTEAMLAQGWVSEVETLLAMGHTRTGAALNSLGYRDILDYLDGQRTWEEAVAAIVKATRQLAKRQLTWFRKMPQISWLQLSGLDEATAIERILTHFQRPRPLAGFSTPITHAAAPAARQLMDRP